MATPSSLAFSATCSSSASSRRCSATSRRAAPMRESNSPTRARRIFPSARKVRRSARRFALAPEDHIFGSHRSHGEFIAKGLSAIDRLDERRLMNIMEMEQGGRVLSAVHRFIKPTSEKALAESFMLFGFLSEIFMRSTGFNGGMGGSMHAFFLPFGAYPNNAIVGASAGIATGAALHKKLQREDGIAVAFAGDGSTGSGPVTEAMNFGAMAQYDRLWPEPYKGGLPVLFFFTNNFYAMGGQTRGETMGWDRLSRIGAGVSPSNLHAETVDGANVARRRRRGRPQARAPRRGQGPCPPRRRGLPHLRPFDDRRQCLPHPRGSAGLEPARSDRRSMPPRSARPAFSMTPREEAMRAEVKEPIRAVTAAAVNPEAAPVDRHRRPADADRRADVFPRGARPRRRRPGARRGRGRVIPSSASSARRAAPRTGRTARSSRRCGRSPSATPCSRRSSTTSSMTRRSSPMARSAGNGAAPSASIAASPTSSPTTACSIRRSRRRRSSPPPSATPSRAAGRWSS